MYIFAAFFSEMHFMRNFYRNLFLITLLFSHFFLFGNTEKSSEEKDFDPKELILEHIGDAHEWHLFTTKDENGHEHHYSIPLPIIVYDGSLKVFMSNQIAHGHSHEGYTLKHGKLVNLEGKKAATLFGLFGNEPLFYDFSITKNVASLLISLILIVWIFTTMARSYKGGIAPPKGIAKFLEPVVIYVRDEIALPNIGEKKYMKFVPYLLTLFFFIWFNNLLGLIPIFPGGANLTGNISVTMVLALLTLIIVNVNGNKEYWRHILLPPVPKVLWVIMIPVEIIGIFTKPFALMMRLFANITAGHIMIISIISLIFIFKHHLFGSPLLLTFFVSLLEILVTLLQAYIFTILTALFIGQAVAEHEHH